MITVFIPLNENCEEWLSRETDQIPNIWDGSVAVDADLTGEMLKRLGEAGFEEGVDYEIEE